jgi:hypothetical protein
MTNLAIVGSRYYKNYKSFIIEVEKWIQENHKPDKIISGGATGVDSMAKKYAHDNNITLIEYLPNWQKFGKSAGPKRNKLIIDDATHLLAFVGPKSVGTYDSIRKAEDKKINVKQIKVDQ